MKRFTYTNYTDRPLAWLANLLLIFTTSALLGGCGLLFGSAAEPTAVPTTIHTVPTFTPTPLLETQSTSAVAPTTVPTQPVTQARVISLTAANATASSIVLTPTVPVTQTAALTPTATGPMLTVNDDAVNLRSGPATSFGLLGTALKGQTFQITAKNVQGDWWQICCINEQSGWIFGELARVENADKVAVAAEIPTPLAQSTATGVATPASVAAVPPTAAAAQPTTAPAPTASADSTAGIFNEDAAYKIVHFHVLGLNENNGGTRDSRAQHLIFVTVLDASGNGVDGAVVKNLVGDKKDIITGGKGPGKAEITMYYDPFKLTVAADPSGPTTSQISNQMGLAFPHIPDIVGQLGGTDYEYAVCPTLEINCTLPIHAVHYSYEITFQKVK